MKKNIIEDILNYGLIKLKQDTIDFPSPMLMPTKKAEVDALVKVYGYILLMLK